MFILFGLYGKRVAPHKIRSGRRTSNTQKKGMFLCFLLCVSVYRWGIFCSFCELKTLRCPQKCSNLMVSFKIKLLPFFSLGMENISGVYICVVKILLNLYIQRTGLKICLVHNSDLCCVMNIFHCIFCLPGVQLPFPSKVILTRV